MNGIEICTSLYGQKLRMPQDAAPFYPDVVRECITR
jgi:hypothetical protein